MKFVLDASVAVAAVRIGEPGRCATSRRLRRLLDGLDDVVIPTLFGVETGAALARSGEPVDRVVHFVDTLLSLATNVISLDPDVATEARGVAMRWKLRGADAVYVSLARQFDLPLCTLDHDMTRRAAEVCQLIVP